MKGLHDLLNEGFDIDGYRRMLQEAERIADKAYNTISFLTVADLLTKPELAKELTTKAKYLHDLVTKLERRGLEFDQWEEQIDRNVYRELDTMYSKVEWKVSSIQSLYDELAGIASHEAKWQTLNNNFKSNSQNIDL